MIVVTGATGKLGSQVTSHLLKMGKVQDFIATSRTEAGVTQLRKQGMQARLADFDDPSSMHLAFSGASKVLLISTMDSNRYNQHQNVIDAAKFADVKHVIYTSLAIKDIHTSAVKELMVSHFQTEEYLIKSGLKYTILRNTMYADALVDILGIDGFNSNINIPAGKGKVPFALRREMGEATANLLLQPNHENVIYNITGSHSYSFSDISKTLKDIRGNQVYYNDISEDIYHQQLKERGFTDFAIYLHSGTIKDVRNGLYEIVDETMEKLLGRPTANLSDSLRELFL